MLVKPLVPRYKTKVSTMSVVMFTLTPATFKTNDSKTATSTTYVIRLHHH